MLRIVRIVRVGRGRRMFFRSFRGKVSFWYLGFRFAVFGIVRVWIFVVLRF